MNVADAEFWVGVAESENFIVLLPAVADGTLNVAPTNEPVELVLVVPLRVTWVPENVAVIAELAANPEPETVTVEPVMPDALTGLVIVIAGLTVKVADPVLRLVSTALIVWAPAADAGTWKVTPEGIWPRLFVCVVVTAVPSKLIVIEDWGKNVWPVIVIV